MAILKLQAPALKQAINQQAENGYVKTIGAYNEAGYRPAGSQVAVKAIGACTEIGCRPADRQVAMLKLQAPALKQAIDQQAQKWLC